MQITPVLGSACAYTGITKAMASKRELQANLSKRSSILVPRLNMAERNLGIMLSSMAAERLSVISGSPGAQVAAHA